MIDPEALRAALRAWRDQPDRLIDIIIQQAGVIEQLQGRVAELEALVRELTDRNQRLQHQVEELHRTTARQAAPFRLTPQKRCQTPQRPGRRPGHRGTGRPRPAHVDVAVDVPLTQCPQCAGPVRDVQPRVQYVEELPPVRPHVTQLTTYEGFCPGCRQRVRSTHPLQVSTAVGAAGVHLGPRALALAALLNKHYGLTMRKTCAVLQALGGLTLTPGGLAQAVARVAARLAQSYEALIADIRAGPWVHSDETSWWVGGPGWWLWVFTTPHATVYRIAPGRGRPVVHEVLGPTYGGVRCSDCLAVYDEATGPQHKCYAHHLRAVAAVAETHPSPYAEDWRTLLHTAMRLKRDAPVVAFADPRRQPLEEWADRLVATPRPDPLEEALRRRFAKQRDHLFTFLDYAEVPATNNLAERQLRPAVITRKLSCGNKTPQGAHTWAILASLAASCAQRAESFVDVVAPKIVLAGAR